MSQSATDPWDWYKSTMAGQKPPVHDGQPQCGFFRKKLASKGITVAAAIWLDDAGQLVCRIGSDDTLNAHKEWAWLARHAIPEADAHYWFEHGDWQGKRATEAPPSPTPLDAGAGGETSPKPVLMPSTTEALSAPAPIGDNTGTAPPSEEDVTLEQMQGAIEGAALWLKATKIDTEDAANNAANRVGRLRELIGKIRRYHTTEKAPITEAGRKLDARYLRPIDRADDAVKTLLGALTAWQRVEQARRDKLIAQQRAEQEAAEAKRQADIIAAEKAAAKGKSAPPIDVPLPLPAAPKLEEKVRIGGATGKRISLRTVTVVDVTDHAKALKHFAKHPDIIALVEKLARSAVLAGTTIPGTTKREESSAA
ncbi:MAG: hypothetical protein ABL901_02740 [Hyphomicrobiaceae bacterium]|nr:hypothetical protein [Hyphomicrobiaceae bacterium]